MNSRKILIADDDRALLEALVVRFESEGFEVITSQDGYQTVDFARKHKPDVLLIDVNMPAGSGFTVQERIEKIETLAGTPVVYMTGDESADVDRMAHKLGAFAVVHKPFESNALLDTIRASLGYWASPLKNGAMDS